MRPYLFVYFAEDFSRRFNVEQANDDPGVLAFQVGHCSGGVGEEALPGGDLDVALFGAVIQVIQSLKKAKRNQINKTKKEKSRINMSKSIESFDYILFALNVLQFIFKLTNILFQIPTDTVKTIY